MLSFFRRYQQFFYIFITVIIIISFSFFGTYGALSQQPSGEATAFIAVDGTAISRSEVEEMVLFIGTDMEDKRLFGGSWGPNFLNNGAVRLDLLETGIGAGIAEEFSKELKGELDQRHSKEKTFTLYSHPQAKFLSVENAWNTFMPETAKQFKALKEEKDPTSPSAIKARIALFLAEKRLPAPMLRQLLGYQEKQYQWLAHDPALDRADLSLFGYHTLEDWFGPRFLRLTAQYLINAAKIAEERGYRVSKEEALSDLLHNAAISFEQNANSPYLGVSNSTQYFDEQLRRMRLDRTTAVRLWRQVLLARRLFQDMGSATLVDPEMFKPFVLYANERVEGVLYDLPKELQFADSASLQQFESYLNAVSKKRADPLSLPTEFKEASEVAKKNPELIQHRYALRVSEVTKTNLQMRVGLKETWEWEGQEANWKAIQQQFPELGTKPAGTKQERLAAIDTLDPVARARLDQFARNAIVEAHPDWIKEALDEKTPEQLVVSLSLEGGKFPFSGVSDRAAFIRLLNEAPIGENPADPLALYSGDGIHYYRIAVMNRSDTPEVMTFKEAKEGGAVNTTLEKALNSHYAAIKEKYPQEFQKPDKSWKTFSEASDSVGGRYVASLVKTIGDDYLKSISSPAIQKDIPTSTAASLRFFNHLKKTQSAFLMDPDAAGEAELTRLDEAESTPSLSKRAPLADQWKLSKKSFITTKSDPQAAVSPDAAFKVEEGKWSEIITPANGNLYFFKVMKKAKEAAQEEIAETTNRAHRLLGIDAQGKLGLSLLTLMKEKHALSLEYLLPKAADQE